MYLIERIQEIIYPLIVRFPLAIHFNNWVYLFVVGIGSEKEFHGIIIVFEFQFPN